jgi:hypothetical protein
MSFGSSERPKPGCVGAMTCAALDRRRGRFDAILGVKKNHRPARAAFDHIDARSFDDK